MRYHWLNKCGNDTLIIFFGGWSFDYKPFEFLECADNDVVMLYDYSDITLPALAQDYKEYYLIGWSMGVFTAYFLRDKLPEFNRKIAVNGTVFPVDDTRGIPRRTFDLTLKYIDIGLSGKFYQNIFYKQEDYLRYISTPVERSIENRKFELIKLDERIKDTKINYESFYDTAVISEYDKIIPPKNQHNAWDNGIEIISLEDGHFPFYNWKSWNDIICR